MGKIRLYLLTGFLGSGKTTFLQKTLKKLEDHKVAVIMNEFGKTGIDGEIIRDNRIELKEINRGSIFCSCLELSFVEALIEMSQKDIEYLFVESSGLADPSNIGKFLEAVEANVGPVYEYMGAITLIDGQNFLNEVSEVETVERQLKFSHLALISKTDLISEVEKQKVIDKVKEINEKVIIADSVNGDVDYEFLDRDIIRGGWLGIEDTTNSPDNKPKTLTLTYKGNINKKKFIDFIEAMSDKAYRMKGFFMIEGKWTQVDVVGRTIDLKDTDKSFEDSKLVIISKIGNAIIRPIFAEFEKNVGEEMTLR